jgi:hypothetical protein
MSIHYSNSTLSAQDCSWHKHTLDCERIEEVYPRCLRKTICPYEGTTGAKLSVLLNLDEAETTHQREGSARPSFVTENLDDPDLMPEKEDLVRWTSLSLFGAGFETVCTH